jgi:hypothetical protein
VRLAIADPPYLGRANRWYGGGRGSGRVISSGGRPATKPDFHPEAAEWDRIERHAELIQDLTAFDGWALAGTAESGARLLPFAPVGTRLAAWVRPNAMPAGARVITAWESVLYYVPDGRRARIKGQSSRDALVASTRPSGFLGSKPPEWTHWVLDLLGYDAETDTVADLFPGSGAVSAAVPVPHSAGSTQEKP